MIKRLERLKNTVNKYMADLRPDQLTIYQTERKLVVSRRPGVFLRNTNGDMQACPSANPHICFN
jgi:hypothetical protein